MLDHQVYDIVHFEHLWMSQYLDRVSNCKTVVDEVDVDSVVLFRRYRQTRKFWKRWYLFWCWLRTVQLEVKAFEQVDLVFARSDKDRKYLQCLVPGQNIQELPPWFEGVNKPSFPSDLVEEYSLLFVGNMRRSVNIEAVVYFCRHILPRVRKAVPDAKLYIVGDSPSEQVRRLANEHVIVTGYVEDLREYYARCQVFVAPLLVGGGIIVKVLDALATGRPVVCTSVANEGIEAVPGRDLYVADSPEKFAEYTVELLTDHERWQGMSKNGRAFVEHKYSWKRVIDGLEHAYASLLRED
jgi:glycosyltransferase involved in cell wall biosynthesis